MGKEVSELARYNTVEKLVCMLEDLERNVPVPDASDADRCLASLAFAKPEWRPQHFTVKQAWQQLTPMHLAALQAWGKIGR